MEKYNGWKNYETWNVALWLMNDSYLNEVASKFRNKGYRQFVDFMSVEGGTSNIAFQTPDKVEWNDPTLDVESLDELLFRQK